VINTTINPQFSLFNVLPIRPSNQEKVKYAYLTQIDDPTGALPDGVCEQPQRVGDVYFCNAEFDFGRKTFSTKTMEMDALIRYAKAGSSENFYMLGTVRGTSAIPSQEFLNDRDFVARSAVRRQMSLIGRAFQRAYLRELWTGDPANVALNTVNGGAKQFWGLDTLISADYGTLTFVTGTNCAALNSVVMDFGSNTIGGTTSLFSYMQEIEQETYNRASMQGLLPAQWVWVMHPLIWSQVTKTLPCELLDDSCGATSGGASSAFIISDTSTVQLRRQLEENLRITINGRTIPVVLDHGIAISNTGTAIAPTYLSNIYLVPLRAGGEIVTEIRHRDYRDYGTVLSAIPTPGNDLAMNGWSDGGRYSWIVEKGQGWCFDLWAKSEISLVFRAPHLAGKIENVLAATLIEQTLAL
jgi:hypothetical protein